MADESRGSNLILSASGNGFEHVTVRHIEGARIRTRGFSAVKLLPGSPQVAVALRTEELQGRVATYLTMLHINGTILMADTHIADRKYEGIEIAGA